ncbi:hypothetical protein B0H17DRAFT_1073508 [Mycena rosella]|uniref:F-box domain-containing protein n=1 Tax=Mycena rosella TaxID=1033263 RepID=A0AAD7D8D5_MYCRO|nr:hypothetical protein B0H17DRAFT_1073508 [Mycena rosella]
MEPRTVDYCTKVPAELWLRICDHSSRRDLRKLVFVCHYFRDLFQPLLFRHQCLKAPQRDKINPWSWMRMTRRLHNSLVRVRKLAVTRALAVREWHFQGSLGLAGLPQARPEILHINLIPEAYTKLVQNFCNTLVDFQNLRALRISVFIVDPAFRQILPSLERLEEFAMEDCEVSGRTGPILALRHLSLTAARRLSSPVNSALAQPIHITSPETLHTLTVDDSPDACALLSTLHSNSIVTLHIKLSEIAQYRSCAMAFLEHCPNVRCIEISRPSTLSGTFPRTLPHTAFPNLMSFKGSTSLGALVTSDRPVSAVEFLDLMHREAEVINAIISISRSSVPLRSLSLEISVAIVVEIASDITAYFPELRELALRLHSPAPTLIRTPAYRADGLSHRTDDDSNSDVSDWDMDDDHATRLAVDERTLDISDNDNLIPGHRPPLPPVLDERPACREVTQSATPYNLGTQGSTSLSRIQISTFEHWGERTDTDSPVEKLIDSLCAGRISLPTGLTGLHFKGVQLIDLRESGVSRRTVPAKLLSVQRRVVSALEQQLPALRAISFVGERGEPNVWTRDEDGWRLQGGRR